MYEYNFIILPDSLSSFQKNRRQKTASESSSCRYSRRSEDREGGEESSGDEAVGDNRSRLLAQSPRSAEHTFPPEGVGGATGGIGPDCSNDIDDSMSVSHCVAICYC